MQWDTLANNEILHKTIDALKENGIDSIIVDNKAEAKEKILQLIPKGAEVMTMTSITLDEIEVVETLNDSGEYDSVKNKLMKLDRATDGAEMQKLGAAPEWAVGSVHAVTEDGKVVVVSNTGSQLPAYAYAAQHVLWIVGTQKIVKNLDDATTRIYDYILPLETKRARVAYGLPDTFNSNVSKVLIINKELAPQRLTIIFVKEKLGF
jgi:L-lactate utilization protein LutC